MKEHHKTHRLVRLASAALALLSGFGMAVQSLAAPAASADGLDFLNLSVDAAYQLTGRSATLTVTFPHDVGPTPYYLEIFDQTTGALVKACASGTSCSAQAAQASPTTHKYIAYKASYSTTNPPPNTQATSQTVSVTWRDSLVLNGRTVQNAGSPVTLTASSATDVGPTPFYIEIFNKTTGRLLKACGTGTTCSASDTSNMANSTDTYVAYIGSWSTTSPPPSLQATSNPITVFWQWTP